MRVVAVVITPPTYRASGAVSAATALSRVLARRMPYELALMATESAETTEGDLRVRRCAAAAPFPRLSRVAPKEIRTALTRSLPLERYLRTVRADLVHFHNPVPPLALLRCTEECRRRGIPYVISAHGFYEMQHFADAYSYSGLRRMAAEVMVMRPFVRAVRGAAAVFMLSPNEAEGARAWGIPAEKLHVVTNGVDGEYLMPAPAARVRDVSTRFGLREGACKFLFVGNHTANKGIDILLRAAHMLPSEAQVIVAGAIRSREEHERLLAATRAGELEGRLVFTDYLDDADLRALYAACDVFVFPSRADTLPLAVLQAMACGLPVVASSVGGIPWQLADGAGVLVPPNDVEATARAMSCIALDPDARARLGRSGAARVRAMFDWDASADAAIAGYRAVLSRRRVPSVGAEPSISSAQTGP